MDEKKARAILKGHINPDDSLGMGGHLGYIEWVSDIPDTITLDGEYSIEELEAILWWMKNKAES